MTSLEAQVTSREAEVTSVEAEVTSLTEAAEAKEAALERIRDVWREDKTACFDELSNPQTVLDPGCLSRIRIFCIPDTGSEVKKIPDPGSGSASKNLNICYPKNCF